MNVFLIVIDTDPYADPMPLAKIAKTFPSHQRLNASAYLVKTNETAQEVWEALSHYLGSPADSTDKRFYVIAVCQPHAGWGPQPIRQWLEAHLPEPENSNPQT